MNREKPRYSYENRSPRKGKAKKSAKWSSRLMISYLLILIVPLAFCGYAYTKAISALDKTTSSYHISMLSQAQHSLETQMKQAALTAIQIARETEINTMLYAVEQGNGSPFKIWEVTNLLSDYTAANSAISQAYIGVRKDLSIISSSSHYNSGEKLILNGSADITDSPIFEYSGGKWSSVSIKDDKINEAHTLMYTRTFPEGTADRAYGNVCLVLNQNMLEDLLEFSNQWYGGCNLVLNENNEIIVQSGSKISDVSPFLPDGAQAQGSFITEPDGEAMSVTYIRSPDSGYMYISVYPREQALSDIIYLRNILQLYMAIAVAIGLLLSIFFAFRNTRPVKALLLRLGGEGELLPDGRGDEFNVISHSLDNLIAQKHILTEQTQGQRETVRDALFRVLLSSQAADGKTAAELSREIGVNLGECAFIGMTFSLEGTAFGGALPINSAVTAFIRHAIAYRFAVNGCAYYMPEDSMTALICYPRDEKNTAFANLREVVKETGDLTSFADETAEGLRPAIGISSSHDALNEAYLCTEESAFACEYSKLFEFGRAVWYDMINERISPCTVTLSNHQQLLNVLKSGDTAEAQNVFNDLINRSMVENHLSAGMAEQFFYSIKGVLTEGADFGGDDGLLHSVNDIQFRENELLPSFLKLEELYMHITEIIGEKKNKKGNSLARSISEYIGQNYGDANITVTSTADRFCVSESYLARLFKEYTGESFAAYLENERISKAKVLLTDGDLKMTQIAEAVGYNSVESFRRAFKRIVGVSPSEYREG